MALTTEVVSSTPGPLVGTAADWRLALPVLRGERVTLRELRRTDAPSLLEMLTTDVVAKFISAPPNTVEGFERFIAWAQQERAKGRYACFAVVPAGCEHAVGLLQVHEIEEGFESAEWGFAIGAPFWGTGLFADAANAMIQFAFETIGTTRLEARVAVPNARGNAVLAKMGAVREAVLRRSFLRHGEYLDQALWSILRHDWRRSKTFWGTVIH